MSQPLRRFHRRQELAEDLRFIARIIDENPMVATAPSATLPGDSRRLRGIPCVARGVAGAIPGSSPAKSRIFR